MEAWWRVYVSVSWVIVSTDNYFYHAIAWITTDLLRMDMQGQFATKFASKYNNFHSKKYISKFRL